MSVQEGLLSIMFSPEGERAEVLLHTIPEGKAYTMGFDVDTGFASGLESQEGLAERLLKMARERCPVLKRNDCDDLYGETLSAVMYTMFSRSGLEVAKFGEHFYAGMGHSGTFLGRISYTLDGRTLTLGSPQKEKAA